MKMYGIAESNREKSSEFERIGVFLSCSEQSEIIEVDQKREQGESVAGEQSA